MGCHRLPDRVVDLARARALQGDFPDRFLPALHRTDPLVDAVVAEDPEWTASEVSELLRRGLVGGGSRSALPSVLRPWFDQLNHVPVWVDWSRIDRAGGLLFRTGTAGGIVLGARSLALSYCSPGGNKPLALSGRLAQPGLVLRRRLHETSRFVTEVCRPGGMKMEGAGFSRTVQVRWLHAKVRHRILAGRTWEAERWGAPINQHDMVAATLLFSTAFVDGLRLLGFRISDDEADAYLQLWRYNGYVIGVEPELLPATVRDAQRLTACIEITQGPPDDDSKRLVRALVEAPSELADTPEAQRVARIRARIGYGFVRTMIGDARADALGLPRTTERHALPFLRAGVSLVERLGHKVPSYRTRCIRAGERHWTAILERPREGAGAEPSIAGWERRMGERVFETPGSVM